MASDNPIVVLAGKDARGQASAGESEMLRSKPEEWYSALVSIVHDLQSQFSDRKADLLAFQQECMKTGQKQRFFEEKSIYEDWKATAIRFRQSVQERLQEARVLRKGSREQDRDDAVGGKLRTMAEAIERIESVVSEILEAVCGDKGGRAEK